MVEPSPNAMFALSWRTATRCLPTRWAMRQHYIPHPRRPGGGIVAYDPSFGAASCTGTSSDIPIKNRTETVVKVNLSVKPIQTSAG